MVLGCRGVRGGRQEMGVNYDRSPSPPVQSCLDYLSAAKQTARERERGEKQNTFYLPLLDFLHSIPPNLPKDPCFPVGISSLDLG